MLRQVEKIAIMVRETLYVCVCVCVSCYQAMVATADAASSGDASLLIEKYDL